MTDNMEGQPIVVGSASDPIPLDPRLSGNWKHTLADGTVLSPVVQSGSAMMSIPPQLLAVPSSCPICGRLYASTMFPSGLMMSISPYPPEIQHPELCFRKEACATQECPDCKWMIPGGRHSQEDCQRLKASLSGNEPAPQTAQSGIRRFVLRWDNSRTIRKLEQLRHYQLEGVQFSSGHAAIDTPALFGVGTFFEEGVDQIVTLYQKRGMVIVEWVDNSEEPCEQNSR